MREPIDGGRVAEAILPWRLDLRQETGSSNADAAERARAGEPEGLVVMAESQVAGRGRLGRTWVSPPRAGLAVSVLLRPAVEMSRWGWLPLLAGVALAETITDVQAGLKWPNDLLVDGRKCAGILAETVAPGAVVLGIGLNVSLTEPELPQTPAGLPATSLLLAGSRELDRTRLAITLLRTLRQRYEDWLQNKDLRTRYLEKCLSIGREVRISLPDGSQILGLATAVDEDGRLVVRTGAGQLCPIAAGDVTHVR